MIVLFDDFGCDGPYVGQVKMVIERARPGTVVIDLMHDAPGCNPVASAYLLAALGPRVPPGAVVLSVVDPGVGSDRRAAILRLDDRWYVGPDNGLFNVVLARAERAEWWDVTWEPEKLSNSFHGRDLFAPMAAALCEERHPPGDRVEAAARLREGWPADLAEVIYIDRYGNAITGVRDTVTAAGDVVSVKGRDARYGRTFSELETDGLGWYVNSLGLVELAMNGRSAAETFGLEIGTPVSIRRG